MYYFLNEINDYSELNDIIRDCEEKQRQILNEKWQAKYEHRCLRYYMGLDELTKSLDGWNYCDITNNPNFISNWIYSNPSNSESIRRILEFIKVQNLSLTRQVILMTCESCVCEGCKYMKDCLEHTCKECATNGFIKYRERCNE